LQPGTLHDVAYDVIALPDTTILVCGVAQHNGNNAMFVGHLLEDGSLDPAFGTDQGYTFFNVGQEAYAYAMGLGDDGSIYLAGLAYPTFAQSTVVLAHTDADGMPDMAFGTNGVVSTPVGTLDAEARGLVVQSDGKILLGGSVVNDVNFARDILFMRYEPDGTLDSTFSGDGIAIASAYVNEDLLNDIALLADGSIVGAGYVDINFTMKTILARVDANGDFMTAFDGDGLAIPGFGIAQDRAFGILADGQQFLVTGAFMDNPNDNNIYLAEFNDDASLVSSFGTNGVTVTDVNVNEVGFDIAKGTDGGFIVCGTSGQFGFGSARDFIVTRYTAAGIPDAGFGTNGSTITSIGVDFDDANAVAVQPDGKIVAAGFAAGLSNFTDNDLAVVRYLVEAPSFVGAVHPAVAPVLLRQGDLLTIRSASAVDRAELMDVNGRVVLDRRGNGAQEMSLPLDGTAAGIYLVRLWCNGAVSTTRFMR
jgi:uncharacterized delta-60 repeat protein